MNGEQRDICPRFTPGPWIFTGECNWERHPDRSCQYCGSMHPDDFMARVEAGTASLGATDKNYKVYVANAGGDSFKQTYRDCYDKNPDGSMKFDAHRRVVIKPPECHGPDDCTHWVTRDTDHAKFYFYHLSEDQQRRFVDLLNAKALKFEGGIGFYVRPFFIGRAA